MDDIARWDHLTMKQREALCRRFGHKFSFWLIIGKDKCDRCGETASDEGERRRTPMTEQQRRLMGFYHKGERAWHDDIRSRRVVPAHLQKKYGAGVVRVPVGKKAPWE